MIFSYDIVLLSDMIRLNSERQISLKNQEIRTNKLVIHRKNSRPGDSLLLISAQQQVHSISVTIRDSSGMQA